MKATIFVSTIAQLGLVLASFAAIPNQEDSKTKVELPKMVLLMSSDMPQHSSALKDNIIQRITQDKLYQVQVENSTRLEGLWLMRSWQSQDTANSQMKALANKLKTAFMQRGPEEAYKLIPDISAQAKDLLRQSRGRVGQYSHVVFWSAVSASFVSKKRFKKLSALYASVTTPNTVRTLETKVDTETVEKIYEVAYERDPYQLKLSLPKGCRGYVNGKSYDSKRGAAVPRAQEVVVKAVCVSGSWTTSLNVKKSQTLKVTPEKVEYSFPDTPTLKTMGKTTLSRAGAEKVVFLHWSQCHKKAQVFAYSPKLGKVESKLSIPLATPQERDLFGDKLVSFLSGESVEEKDKSVNN